MSSSRPVVKLEGSVLSVTGKVDANTVIELRKQGENLVGSATGALRVDLAQLDTAHSVVLSMLMCWQRLAQSKQVALSFEGASDRLQSLAALSNLDAHLPGFSPHS
ncbi:lipid asymmetry maintenance protein MlaB [Marinobacter sp. MDS2]|uniref:STAS domain-containing protein n=1 Tax=Marinobacter sp. MDS2 TaxID=3065961 RepID=UPI00273C6238|nr:STAS domain-containing protein [Marinobacter sp. MDS2]MDP4546922.1 STAS domain-containing protein [Marinobacter sp. MDS2]